LKPQHQAAAAEIAPTSSPPGAEARPALFPPAPLDLSGLSPVAHGTKRELYLLDDLPGLVLKVVKPPERHIDSRSSKRWVRRLFPMSAYRFLFREYDCYLQAKLVEPRRQGPLPISELAGLVQTSAGVGMLAEAILDASGNLAPRLIDMSRIGLTDAHLVALNDFVARVFAWGLRANDINPGNIVYGVRGGVDQFVLIDGLGDSNLVPLRSWSDRLNERSLHKRFRSTARKIGLVWDDAARAFRRA
jgi:hypothetical protein